MPPAQYDAILCRGVLNDVIDDRDRRAVFAAFHRALRPDGVLMFDVREWAATVERKQREPLFTKRVSTDRGTLTFTSVTELDPAERCLIVTERHARNDDGRETASDYRFVMRCWTRAELSATLAGFDRVAWFGAYEPAVTAGATDRLVVIAQRPR